MDNTKTSYMSILQSYNLVKHRHTCNGVNEDTAQTQLCC